MRKFRKINLSINYYKKGKIEEHMNVIVMPQKTPLKIGLQKIQVLKRNADVWIKLPLRKE